VISNGSLPDERFIVGTAEDIVEKVKKTDIKSPAIIVIGEAVNLNLNAGAFTRRIQEVLATEVAC